MCRLRHTFRPWVGSRRRENEKTFVEPSSRILVSQKLPNYLRAYRKRAGLSQADVAYLLGVRSGTKVSRYERFSRVPNLETALAFEALYHLPVADLFAGAADDRARDVLRRARLLERRLLARTKNPALTRKLAALHEIVAVDGEEVQYESLPHP